MACMAKITGLYFTEKMVAAPCCGERIILPSFWAYSPNGNLDAEICRMHAGLFVAANPRRSYLTERIQDALTGTKRVGHIRFAQ